jgi:hypothetical protein
MLESPLGISTCQLKDSLPEPLKESLPSVEQLEMEMGTIIAEVGMTDSSDIEDS